MALCYSSNHTSYFIYVLSNVDIHDLSIHNSLAVFTSILIGKALFYFILSQLIWYGKNSFSYDKTFTIKIQMQCCM